MSKYLKEILKEIGHDLKVGALVLLVLLPIAAIVAVPVMLATLYLPDWAYWTLFGCGFLWFMFGDSVSKAVRRVKRSS